MILRRPGFHFVPLLIYINVFIYILWWFEGSQSAFMQDNFLVSWSALADGRWWVLISSVFSHSMFFHIFINMIVLKDFGDVVEALLGSRFFIIFYLLAGIFSSICHAVVSAFVLGEPDLPALGASGAVCGLLMLFCLIFPKRKILLFALIPIPALFGALLLIGLDIWGLVAQAEGGGLPIGHGAHLGGAFAGVVAYFLVVRPQFKQLRQRGPQPQDSEFHRPNTDKL